MQKRAGPRRPCAALAWMRGNAGSAAARWSRRASRAACADLIGPAQAGEVGCTTATSSARRTATPHACHVCAHAAAAGAVVGELGGRRTDQQASALPVRDLRRRSRARRDRSTATHGRRPRRTRSATGRDGREVLRGMPFDPPRGNDASTLSPSHAIVILLRRVRVAERRVPSIRQTPRSLSRAAIRSGRRVSPSLSRTTRSCGVVRGSGASPPAR